jgi:hypothetical protein
VVSAIKEDLPPPTLPQTESEKLFAQFREKQAELAEKIENAEELMDDLTKEMGGYKTKLDSEIKKTGKERAKIVTFFQNPSDALRDKVKEEGLVDIWLLYRKFRNSASALKQVREWYHDNSLLNTDFLERIQFYELKMKISKVIELTPEQEEEMRVFIAKSINNPESVVVPTQQIPPQEINQMFFGEQKPTTDANMENEKPL